MSLDMSGVFGTPLVMLTHGTVVLKFLESHHLRSHVFPVLDICGKFRNTWYVYADSQECDCGFPEPDSACAVLEIHCEGESAMNVVGCESGLRFPFIYSQNSDSTPRVSFQGAGVVSHR